MNSLASRKQLLIAESDLNRAQLFEEGQMMVYEVRSVTGRARTILTLATAAVSLVAGLASFRRHKSAPAGHKPRSWRQTILKGVPLLVALWSEFRRSPKS